MGRHPGRPARETFLVSTLNDLDPTADPGRAGGGTSLTRRCSELRSKPLEDFTAEDLRIMIAQQLSLDHLVPLALTMVERNALVEGDFYSGDLLAALFAVSSSYWQDHGDEWVRLFDLAQAVDKLVGPAREFLRRSD